MVNAGIAEVVLLFFAAALFAIMWYAVREIVGILEWAFIGSSYKRKIKRWIVRPNEFGVIVELEKGWCFDESGIHVAAFGLKSTAIEQTKKAIQCNCKDCKK